MHTYRALAAVTEEYFANHLEEIDDFLQEIFAEYAQGGDSGTLLSQLRTIASVKGVATLAG